MAALKKILTSLKKLFKFRKKASRRKVRRKIRRPVSRRRTAQRRKKTAAVSGKKKISRRAGKKPSLKRKSSRLKLRKQDASSKQIPSDGVRPDQVVGEITHFFPRIQVAVVKMLKGSMRTGDRIRIKGRTTDSTQAVRSMQIESVDVKAVRKGQILGLKVDQEARVGDKVYKLP